MQMWLQTDGARFSVETLETWHKDAVGSRLAQNASLEGLQIWLANGDWLFLTEQIESSANLARTLSDQSVSFLAHLVDR